MTRSKTFIRKTASLLPLVVLPGLAHADPRPEHNPRAVRGFGVLPVAFEANHGQVDESVHFLVRNRGHGLFLTSTGSVLVLRRSASDSTPVPGSEAASKEVGDGETLAALRMRLIGAHPTPKLSGTDVLPGKVNYLTGPDPDSWHTGIPTFARVTYDEVYPGIDLVYYGGKDGLAYDFVVAPGAEPDRIRLAFEGVDSVELDDDGDLVLAVGEERVRIGHPHLYQERPDGTTEEVSGGFVLREDRSVALEVGAYDRSRTLVIDPTLDYSTYLGGTNQETGGGIAIDDQGAVYITGETRSLVLPPPPGPLDAGPAGFQPSPGGGLDAFVIKLDPDGMAMAYATYLGGSQTDRGSDIAVDGDGSAYVVGSTDSADFPVTHGAYDTTCGADGTCDGDVRKDDAFVTKISPDGATLAWSTFLGGPGDDNGNGIAVDGSKSAYVTGTTAAVDFPIHNGFQGALAGSMDAFLVRMSVDGSSVAYATLVGGAGYDVARRVAVDTTGRAWLTGYTNSWNFPTANPCRPRGASSEAFVAGIDTTVTGGASLAYATTLGGSDMDNAWTIHAGAIAIDGDGLLHLTGSTRSTDFPTANAFQTEHGGERADAFVAVLDPSRGPDSCLVYSSYFGGSGLEVGTGIAVDEAGTAYVTGYTTSEDFPLRDPMQPELRRSDAFVAQFDPNLVGDESLVYASYLGGSMDESGKGIATTPGGHPVLVGETGSDDFPTENAIQPYRSGSNDLFVSKVVPNQAPVAAAGPDIELRCRWLDASVTPVASATLDGSASFDPDGDLLEYTWTGAFPEGDGEVSGVQPTVTAPVGSTPISLVVDDGLLESAADTLNVLVHCTPQEQMGLIQGEIDLLVASGVLRDGHGGALNAKLDDAIRLLDRGRLKGATQMVRDFVDQVDAFVRSGHLPSADGDRLRAAANDVIARIGADARL